MKRLVSLLQVTLLGVAVYLVAVPAIASEKISSSKAFTSRIEGMLYGPDKRPVPDVWVELQNELGTTLVRDRTQSSGRFSFSVNGSGNFVIKVLTNGTNYEEYSQEVEVVTMSTNVSPGVTATSADNQYVDIYLKIDKRKINSGLPAITEAVYVQEIPSDARKLYDSGLKDMQGHNEEKGLDEMEQSLKIFPNYFDALNMMGRTYVWRKEYEKSLPYLIKAIDINQRSYSSFYALAQACNELNHRPEALEAARAATIIQSNSVMAQLLYGTLLRQDGSYEKAEKVLLQAKTLSKDAPVPEISRQLALLYNKTGRNKEAADELEMYLKLDPDAPDKQVTKNTIIALRKDAEKSKTAVKEPEKPKTPGQ